MTSPAGFPRQVRLLCRRDFDRVFQKPGRSSDPYFTILFKKNDLQDARLGLAVAKKMAKRAVDRNRIKRIIREHFRQHNNKPQVDLVVMIKPQTAAANHDTLQSSLDHHWLRIKRKLKHDG